MIWLLTIVPVVTGAIAWRLAGTRRPELSRTLVGSTAVVGLVGTAAIAVVAAAQAATGSYTLGGGLVLRADMTGPADIVSVVVPLIGAVVVAYAAAHEPPLGLGRLVGLLTAFVGVMELIVTAADLISLTVGFELVGGLSWVLIGHDWRKAAAPASAAHAFNATRFGSLALFLAAGAAFAGTGSFAFADLDRLAADTALSGNLQVVAAGVLLAAVAKSAQGPFAPWLFSAMAGPTPVSALLHSSTMVAAGAYALIRLQPVLDTVGWFGPTTIVIGLVTAFAGGIVALLQPHAKKLLAASTSAQYGLMLVAIGAGYPAVAAIHLVVHAVFKAQLFLSAGIAIEASGSSLLGAMRLGSHLRTSAILAATGSVALAAIPPLGGAWSKDAIIAAAGHESTGLAILTILAGGLSAAYATRFQVLAFGPTTGDGTSPRTLAWTPSRTEVGAVGLLAGATVALSVLWIPLLNESAAGLLGGEVAPAKAWELAASVLLLTVAAYAVFSADRAGRLGHLGTTGPTAGMADWMGLPTVTRIAVVEPALVLALAAAWFDDHVIDRTVRAVGAGAQRAAGIAAGRLDPLVARVVVGSVTGATTAVVRTSDRFAEDGIDAAVEGVAWLVDRAGTDARRTHTGMVHHQFIVIAIGVVVAILAAVLGR